ncbi:IPT/TIG domain-containing protein [Sphingobacterium sp. HMA12]|uniref:IPT/TIG domain-containing protein n=1 Tax=Sphingobacterium sp. HMA12 TaxID=2050894 RepID=UPI000CE9FA34|nr:IPT/TIG domain-containing protein [Sphingobacterium sp. HMA12]
MKKINRYSLFQIFLYAVMGFAWLGCSTKEEIIPDTKPIQIKALLAGNVTASIVTLNAEVQYLNDEVILDHGFMIMGVNNSNPEKVSLGKTVKAGPINLEYKSKSVFELDAYYSYYYYIQTEKQLYQSDAISFTVKDFWVDQQSVLPITLGDTLRLTGNFKQLNNYNIVKVSNMYPQRELSILQRNNESIDILIPKDLGNHGQTMTILVSKSNNGPNSNFSREQSLANIKLLGKVEFSVNGPHYFGDDIPFKSYGLHWGVSNFNLIISNRSLSYFDDNGKINLSGLNITQQSIRLGYYNGVDTIIAKQKLELIRPNQDIFETTNIVAHPRQMNTMRFTDLFRYFGSDYYNMKIFVGDSLSSGLSYYGPDSMYFQMPNLPDGSYKITINTPQYGNIVLTKPIEIKKLKYEIQNKMPYYIGDEITLKGNFLDNTNYVIKINDFEIFSGAAKNSMLKFKLWNANFGKERFQVGIGGGDYYPVYPDEGEIIDVPGIRIDSFSPASGYAGDILTITGKGFANMYSMVNVFVGDVPAKVISYNNTSVKIYVPITIRKGLVPIRMMYYIPSGEVVATQKFEAK